MTEKIRQRSPVGAAFAAALALAVAWALPAEATSRAALDPPGLYGGGIDFDVIRDGERIGFHEVRFVPRDGGWDVRSVVDLEVRFLAIFAFKYRYEADALWIDGELKRLRTDADDDGDRSSLLAVRSGETLRVRFNDDAYITPAPLIPTNHWNAAVLGQDRVLNTLTGNVNTVKLVKKGREAIATERGEVMATHYIYTGELTDTEVWYDDAGRWVKLRFLGRDGTSIEYACRRCQGGNVAAER